LQRVFSLYDLDVDIASATSTTIVFNAAEMIGIDDYYNGMTIIVWGGTGIGQSRVITDYIGSSKTATISPPWGLDPDTDSDVMIIPGSGVPDVNVAQWLGTAAATPTTAGVPEVDVVQLNGDIQAAISLGVFWDGVWNNLDIDVDSATSTTIVFDAAGMSAANDFYNGMVVLVYSGTGLGQSRVITGYVGSTKTATVSPAWGTNPDNTSDILIVPGPGVPDTNVAQWLGTAPLTPNTAGLPRIDVDRIKNDSAAGDAMARIFGIGTIFEDTITAATATTVTLSGATNIPASSAGNDDLLNNRILIVQSGTGAQQVRVITDYDGTTQVATVATFDITPDTTSSVVVLTVMIDPSSSLTVAGIADGVLDELLSGHTTAGSLGKAVADIETDTAAPEPLSLGT
ncbi:MAG: hypothetical protein V3S26_04205, partial [Acidimicrobiia bacterium]